MLKYENLSPYFKKVWDAGNYVTYEMLVEKSKKWEFSEKCNTCKLKFKCDPLKCEQPKKETREAVNCAIRFFNALILWNNKNGLLSESMKEGRTYGTK